MEWLLNDKNPYKIVKRKPLTLLQKSVISTLMVLNEIDALNEKYNNPIFELSQTLTMLPKGYGLWVTQSAQAVCSVEDCHIHNQ